MNDGQDTQVEIGEAFQAIADLKSSHREKSGSLQQMAERITAFIGCPSFVAGLSVVMVLWIGGNLAAKVDGLTPWDAPPFYWLQGACSLMAVYFTILILATQRHEDKVDAFRDQMTLELANLNERKSAKIIALLEELRRDSPHLQDRHDPEASEMSVASTPQGVLDAIQDSHEASERKSGER